MRYRIYIVLLVFLSLALAQCSRPKEGINCSGTVSFRQDVIPIFQTHCAISGCHTGANPTGYLKLDSAVAYTDLVSGGYFHAGQASYSILYNKVTGGGGTSIMPPTGKLSDSLTNKIYCWIQQGATDN